MRSRTAAIVIGCASVLVGGVTFAQELTQLVDALSPALDREAEGPRGAAVELLYWLVRSPDPSVRAAMEEALVREDRLRSLVELSAAEDREAGIALAAEGILEALSIPLDRLEAVEVTAIDEEEGWMSSERVGAGEAWLRIEPGALAQRSMVSVSLADCPSWTASFLDAIELGDRQFGRPVAVASQFEPEATLSERREEVLWLRVRPDGACEGSTVRLTARALPPPLPDVLEASGTYSAELESLEALKVKLPVTSAATYRFETKNLAGFLDTVLRLYSPDDRLIVVDDDGGGEPLASKLEWTAPALDDVAPEARVVTLEVARLDEYRGTFELDFELVERLADQPLDSLGVSEQDAYPLKPARPVLAKLSSGETGYARIAAEGGCAYRLRLPENASVEAEGIAADGTAFPAVELVSAEIFDSPFGLPEPSAVEWLALGPDGDLMIRVKLEEAELPMCEAGPPWCAEAVPVVVLEPGEKCAEPAAAPQVAALSPDAAPLVADHLTWLPLSPPDATDGPMFLQLPGEREGILHVVCRAGDEPCKVTVSPLSVDASEDEPEGAGEATSDDAGALSYAFPATGTYLLGVDLPGPPPSGRDDVRLWLDREKTHDGFRVGDCVKLGEHDEFGGDRNWDNAMKRFVGTSTRITDHRGRDPYGAWVVRVAADDERWAWRTRNMKPGDECEQTARRSEEAP